MCLLGGECEGSESGTGAVLLSALCCCWAIHLAKLPTLLKIDTEAAPEGEQNRAVWRTSRAESAKERRSRTRRKKNKEGKRLK